MASTQSALVTIKAQIPDDALTAALLGTQRSGHGARIREDGLIITIGYVIHEAERVWITAGNGMTVPGFVVGYDYDSGLGLVKSSMPLEGPTVPIGAARDLEVGDHVRLAGSRDARPADARVVAKQEFAGRWEYLIEDAIFTAPYYDSWSGAALLDSEGRLCGIGSLVIQGFRTSGVAGTVNMFVPIDLIHPFIDEVCQHGRRLSPARPWLGVLVHDEHEQLMVVAVYPHCPAHEAGLRPGDIILRIDDAPVEGLAEMFRTIWSLGDAGVDIPMSILRDAEEIETVVRSGDRVQYQRIGTVQ